MKSFVLQEEWKQRANKHAALVNPMTEAFLHRRGLGKRHPIHDFLFTYYSFSPAKLKQWVPSFEEILEIKEENLEFSAHWFEISGQALYLNPQRLRQETIALAGFVEKLCHSILNRAPRFGCFGLHEWAMVYRLPQDELRHNNYPLRLCQDKLASFVESQNLCCTHYDAYRFFTPQSQPLNMFQPTLENRPQHEQGGCLHANMDIYKWATKLWPWIGSDFIAKAFFLALEGRELDMRASPYDLKEHGLKPICIETEEGRKEYQHHQIEYANKARGLRQELAIFCNRLQKWHDHHRVP